jgi:hypothetical protein
MLWTQFDVTITKPTIHISGVAELEGTQQIVLNGGWSGM